MCVKFVRNGNLTAGKQRPELLQAATTKTVRRSAVMTTELLDSMFDFQTVFDNTDVVCPNPAEDDGVHIEEQRALLSHTEAT